MEEHAKQKKAGKAYADKVKEAKRVLLESIKESTKPAYTRADIIAGRIARYIVECKREDRPLTETGVRVALAIDYQTYQFYLNGERDYLTTLGIEGRESDEAIDGILSDILEDENTKQYYDYLTAGECALVISKILQKARDLISLEREERLAKSGRVADIFTMKAREGWQDNESHTTNVLSITARNATEALQLLGFTQDNK